MSCSSLVRATSSRPRCRHDTRLTREIDIEVPLLSAAMDTVTEARLAIALARLGGIGVLHRNLSIEDQAQQVVTVKRSESGMITDPVTVGPDATLAELDALCARYRVSGLPVVDADGTLVGIITNRDMRFVSPSDYAGRFVRDQMTRDAAHHRARGRLQCRRLRTARQAPRREAARSSTRTAGSPV